MPIRDIIAHKRDGKQLSKGEIEYFVREYIRGTIADYHAAALLMAIYCHGMIWDEVYHLTMAMRDSGTVVDLGPVAAVTVDKHSTGGVGDKISLVVAPLVAAAGASVPMVSGRGLGHTGGTLDKLEAIPGFRTDLEPDVFVRNVNEVGLAIMGQSQTIAPADGKLYALRDVTATVSSLPLIASSIMSKKLAVGPDALVFDIKVGRGAVLPSESAVRRLAGLLNRIGQAADLKTVALLTRMDQPLGRAVGNAVEVAEAIGCLKGEGPEDLLEVTLALGTQMLIMAGVAGDARAARRKLEEVLSSGAGLERFRRMVVRQGGDERVVDDIDRLPRAPVNVEVRSPRDGYISRVDALAVGRSSMYLGAGRKHLNDEVDHAVGLLILKKEGDPVSRGEVMAQVLANDRERAQQAVEQLLKAMDISERRLRIGSPVMDLIESFGDESEGSTYR
jgi:pyrimidine-nucleoside phosphorylase